MGARSKVLEGETMIRPSLLASEDYSCATCGCPIQEQEPVIHVCVDPFANGGPVLVATCSEPCAVAAVDDCCIERRS